MVGREHASPSPTVQRHSACSTPAHALQMRGCEHGTRLPETLPFCVVHGIKGPNGKAGTDAPRDLVDPKFLR